MSSKTTYQLLWEGFLKEKQLLNEMQPNFVRLIANASRVAKEKPEILPFNDLFGDKLRIVIPFQQKNVEKIASLLVIFKQVGPFLNYKESYTPIVSQEKKMIKKRRQGDGGTYEEEQIINQILINNGYLDQQGTQKYRTLSVVTALQKFISICKRYIQDLKTDKIQNEYSKTPHTPQFKQNAIESTNTLINHITPMIEWWQKNQAKIIQDQDVPRLAVQQYAEMPSSSYLNFDSFDEDEGLGEVNSRYSIILSRAPIDVLRMSDFANEGINSCHSMPEMYGRNNYFHCTIAEAQNEGAIAFVVETKDLEQININNDEIFSDRQRDIDGIRPVERVRLRTVKNTSTGQTFAATESAVYGSRRILGFADYVKDYVAKQQVKGLVTTDEEGNKKLNLPNNIKELVKLGGDYSDYPYVYGAFNNMLDKVIELTGVEPTEEQKTVISSLNRMDYAGRAKEYSQYKTVGLEYDEDSYDDEDDEDDEDQRAAEAENEFENDKRRAIRDSKLFNFSSCRFNWIWGEDTARVEFYAYFQVSIPRDQISDSFFEGPYKILNDKELVTAIVETLNKEEGSINYKYPDVPLQEEECYAEVGDKSVRVKIYYADTELHYTDFGSRVNDLLRFEREIGDYEDLEEDFISVLRADNILKPRDTLEATPKEMVVKFNDWVENESNNFEKVNDFYYFKPEESPTNVDQNLRGWRLATFPIDKYANKLEHFNIPFLKDSLGQAISQYIYSHEAKTFMRNYNRQTGMFKDIEPQTQIEPHRKTSLFNRNNFYVEIKFIPLTSGGGLGSFTGQTISSPTDKFVILAIPRIKFDRTIESPENIKQLIDYMYGMEENTEAFVELLHEGFQQAISTSGAFQEILKNLQHDNTQKLTESRKRVIKERLKNWYRANKGMK